MCCRRRSAAVTIVGKHVLISCQQESMLHARGICRCFRLAGKWQTAGVCVCLCLQLQLQEFVQSRKFGQVGRGWSYLSVAQKKKLAQAEQTHSHISCASILFLLRILLSLQFKKISACIVISRNRKLACRYQT